MGPGALSQVLRHLPGLVDRRLLVGYATGDDAAVYQLDENTALVFTVDFFPPVANNGYEFGQVAAANALSDVYAMGARPLLALNVAIFPTGLDPGILQEILRGGAEKVAEAGAVLGGGHTVCGDEPMYGLAVIGLGEPGHILTNAGCRAGDVLFLTKPLGTGVLLRALRDRALDESRERALYRTMAELNRDAADAARAAGATGCTDITGFGLLGHGSEMAVASRVSLELDAGALPWLDGAVELAAQGKLPGGAHRNQDHFGSKVVVGPGVSPGHTRLMYDPQTSGGLLVSLPPGREEVFVRAMDERKAPCWRVGRATEQGEALILVR